MSAKWYAAAESRVSPEAMSARASTLVLWHSMEVRSAEFVVELEATQAATRPLWPAWDSRATELGARDAAEPRVKPTRPALESFPEKRTELLRGSASA